jgi:iron complex outermembrane receptor protein
MRRLGRVRWGVIGGGAAVAMLSAGAAQADGATTVSELIVTAQKQEQPANAVGMSITAATGDDMKARGIESVDDLTRLVPGFTIQHSAFNSISFTLRGVGFFNSDLATPGAVTVYVDEAPLAFPAMAKLAPFDLARVEILKGPQGTLFGENATGGAVNYIAAKPTKTFSQGFDASYGNFDRLRVGGFMSGPLGDRLNFRIAVQGAHGGPWQESISRPGDGLGRISTVQVRATLDWRPVDRLDSRLTLTVTHDGSDTEAAQFIRPLITIPELSPGVGAVPIVTKPRAADWTATIAGTTQPFPYGSDTNLYHLAWRNVLTLDHGVTLTSLSAVAQYRMNYGEDPDGTPFHLSEEIDRGGRVGSYFQELRASGRTGRIAWLVGGNLEHEVTRDDPVAYNIDNSVSHVFQAVDPAAVADSTQYTSHLKATTFGVFGRVEYALSETLSLEGALRYNRDDRTFDNCAIATTDGFVRFWNLFRGNTPPPTQLGRCYVVTDWLRTVDNVHSTLDEDSVSWRVGADWTPRPDVLLYANISQGYKAGAVPVLAAATVSQFKLVPQESLLAYEAGVKATALEGRLQTTAAVFYYDYRDKQLRGAELDPNFGPLQALVSIPRSHVTGAEAQVQARPVAGLTLNLSAIYLDTQIDKFTGFDALANVGDQAGTPFPFSPKWQVLADVAYERPLTAGVTGFVGAALTYNSRTYAGIGALDLMRIDDYLLVDLRAGLTLRDGRYRVWVWGKNVGDTYYWSNVFVAGDAASRFVGQPATYGVSLSGRF